MAATQSFDEAPTDSDGSHSANEAPARSGVKWSAKDQILLADSASLHPIHSVNSDNIDVLMAELSSTDLLLIPFI